MLSMVLGMAAYSLLMSSFTSLILLLRRGLKQNVRSPIYILSASDLLTSVLTAVILLINQAAMTADFAQGVQNFTQHAANHTFFNKKAYNDEYRQAYAKFHQKFNETFSDSEHFNGTSCDVNDVLMHYAMFIVPFANAFVSLLSFFLQYSKSMAFIGDKCAGLNKTPKNLSNNTDGNVNNGSYQAESMRNELSIEEKGSKTVVWKSPSNDKFRDSVVKVLENTSIKGCGNKNSKVICFSIASQWLVPILLTVILYFSNTHNMSEVHSSKDMECIFTVNFPFDKYQASSGMTISEDEHNEPATINDYIASEDTVRLSYPDSAEADKVVSKIYEVVRSVLNQTNENPIEMKPATHYDTSELWNVTKYFLPNVSMGQNIPIKKTIVSLESNSSEVLLTMAKQDFNSTTQVSMMVDPSAETEDDVELKLFEDVMKETSQEIGFELQENTEENKSEATDTNATMHVEELADSSNVQMVNDPAYTEVATEFTKTGDNEDTTINTKSKEEIYAEILKRIQSVTTQFEVKEKLKIPPNDNWNANGTLKFKVHSGMPEWNSILSVNNNSALKKGRAIDISEGSENMEVPTDIQFCRKKLCLLSTMFLRVHLLVLLFFIYFVPILISCILQTRAEYRCQNIMEKLETMGVTDKEISKSKQDNNSASLDNMDSSAATENKFEKCVPKSGWFQEESTQRELEMGECSKKSGDWSAIENPNFNENFQRTSRIVDENKDVQGEDDELIASILQETKRMQSLLAILKRSFLLGVLMWTPMFLEVLSKVFLCAKAPEWLVNGFYLIGTSFSVIRNIFNVSMVKIEKTMENGANEKENSIHPSE